MIISSNQKWILVLTTNERASLMYYFENLHEKSCPQKGDFLDEDNWIVICLCTDPGLKIMILGAILALFLGQAKIWSFRTARMAESERSCIKMDFCTLSWSRKIRVGNLSCIITSIFRKSVVLWSHVKCRLFMKYWNIILGKILHLISGTPTFTRYRLYRRATTTHDNGLESTRNYLDES